MTDAATTRWFTPDGYFMCALCFESIRYEDAFRDEAGQKWDMCKDCGEREVLHG